MLRNKIINLTVRDVRFPTSLEQHGSDAMQTDPDYSVAYVVIETTNAELKGYGLTFTVGKGTEIVVCAVKALSSLVVGRTLEEIVSNFRGFYRLLSSDGQMRWIGPEKGVIQLATAAILNAVWDLWARAEGKPLWKLLVDMNPAQLIRCIDFRYITDALTEQEALDILIKAREGKRTREEQMLREGYPAYTTSCAWLGYTDQQLTKLCSDALAQGWTKFKVKVGADIQDDIRRCGLIRKMIGPNNILMVDANQRWDVAEAVAWVTRLAEFQSSVDRGTHIFRDTLIHCKILVSPVRCWKIGTFQVWGTAAHMMIRLSSGHLRSIHYKLLVLILYYKLLHRVVHHSGRNHIHELHSYLDRGVFLCTFLNINSKRCAFVNCKLECRSRPVGIQEATVLGYKEPSLMSEGVERAPRGAEHPLSWSLWAGYEAGRGDG
ncbi:Mitochondrial enolase superfamily member 1 L-fuconate dehydratase [Triplophysa tibetana]|uniref:Mitochondrial enolase superfamily member 1 L-fuconate dehydratase n=1 Tax=Triplophysa tibetana TaxID=1572043 RepID=A0A5A9PPR7_9TELE|nr:Mitochondrial enolase superfamily member 1 L-fuconate dehydratase [Triplophysa tibetana]